MIKYIGIILTSDKISRRYHSALMYEMALYTVAEYNLGCALSKQVHSREIIKLT